MRRRSPPPAAAQPPRPPTRAAESGEEGGDPGKDEVAAPPKGDSALPRSGSGFGSGNAAAPDGPAKSPMKPKKRVTAPPSSDHGSRENLAAGSPSNEVPTPQGDDAAQEDDLPESPPKSKKNRKKKKKALRAGDSGKVAAPDDPAEPTRPQQDVGEVDGRLAESEQEVPPNAGKAKKKASAQARKKPSAKQHAAAQEEEDGDLMAEAEEEVAPWQGDEEDGKGPLPQRKSKRVAALSGSICPPDPKRAKIVDAQKPGFGRKWNGNDEIMILEALVDQIRSGGNVPQEPGHPLFHELVQRLEGRTFNHSDVRDKVRSLKRRYNDVVLSGLAITKDHDLQLHELSCEIWGRSVAHAGDDKQRCLARDEQSSLARDEQKSFARDEEKSLARDEQSSLARDEQKSFARDEKSLARDEEKSLASDEQRSFDDMCKQFPLLAKEIKVLMEGQPAIMELFPRLDGDQVVAIEKKLENLRWIDMKRKKKMAVKMAKIRKGLIYKLEGAAILADGNMIH
ncbi:STOREKEEPER protein [Oryza sativa Japonica Group]|nr:basic salivary proline-rich protein 2 [Oryza sativa Japonica Group]KAF2950418.1 hypothetical protein DAI22_01g185000 [Oryza sativa Japonica Group]